ncbi:MAG: ASKHA domain-containing protein, partial [Planctomycetota bacterium]
MPRVKFLPSKKSADVPPGTELLDAARKAGVEIEASCGGEGQCLDCRVRVASGEVLACRTHVEGAPLTVEVPDPSEREAGHFARGDETHLIRSDLLPREPDPFTGKKLVQVPAAKPEDGLSDLGRLSRALGKEVACSAAVLRELPDAVRADKTTVTLADDRLVRVEPGDTTARHFAAAIDVGTTTVAVQLIDLAAGKIVETRTGYNDQIACGIDIISRINYARRPERLAELRERVLKTINLFVQQLGVDAQEITSAVVSGNTTMTHLLLGIPPEQIRLAPYTPAVLEPLRLADVGIGICPGAPVFFSPGSGSYVGGDITAGLLCTDLSTDTEKVNLFIDIGTNGELVVGNRDFLVGCACSAGPAFEGGGIDCGMRAAKGAIERVDVDAKTGTPSFRTIGGAEPEGICGSGMIDLLANLFTTGWLDPAGKLDRARKSPHVKVKGKKARYIVVPEKDISIGEHDIENVVRAKAAIYSACSLVLRQIETRPEDIARIYIAGGFGRFLPLEKAITLGLLPDLPRDRFRFVGNASLMGSYMVAVRRENRERQL